MRSITHGASLGDHSYVCMILSLPDLILDSCQPRTSSPYWKLNTSILKDEDFLENFSVMYGKLQSKISDYSDIADWWDHCAKPSIKNFCIGVSSHLADIRKNTKHFLYSYLKVALKEKDWSEVVRVRQQLMEILQYEAMGFVVRSRFKENVETEQASLFHANRENKNFMKNNQNELKIGEVNVDNKDKIEAEVLNYFGALFNGHHNRDLEDTGTPFVADQSHLQDFLDGLGTLSAESKAKVAKELTYEEVEHIIKHECDYNKSPGLDGLPYEFYRATWGIIGQDFTRVLQVELARLRLIESDKHGATRLAPKVDGVPSLTELRPITLLNCDYKILTKCFVVRLTPLMPEVIKSGQLCSNGDKNILFGISNLVSTIEYVNQHKVPSYLAGFDMYKAYDRVMLSYLVLVMRAMEFPSEFIQT